MWEKLKNIIQTMGGRAIIVENGEPQYVVLSVEEYLKLRQPQAPLAQQEQPGEAQNHYSYQQNSSNQVPTQGASFDNFSYGFNAGQGGAKGILAQSPTPIDLSDVDFEEESIGNDRGEITLDDLPL